MNANNFRTNVQLKVIDGDSQIHDSVLELEFNPLKQQLTVNSTVEKFSYRNFPDAHVIYDVNSRLGHRHDRTLGRDPEGYMLQLEILSGCIISEFVQGLYAKTDLNNPLIDKMSISDDERKRAVAEIASFIDKVSEFKPIVKFHHVDQYGSDYVGFLNINGTDVELCVANGTIDIQTDRNNVSFRVIKNHANDVISEVRNGLNEYKERQNKLKQKNYFER